MSELYVCKFGGTSMYGAETAAEIFLNDHQNRIAVVSAIGKNPFNGKSGTKATDILISYEQSLEKSDILRARELQDQFIALNERVFTAVGSTARTAVLNDAYRHLRTEYIKEGYGWLGEHVSARLFAELTDSIYLPSGLRFSKGELQLGQSLDTVRQDTAFILNRGSRIVTEGFFGYDISSGRVCTLPRGGSDISGVIYAGALNGSRQIWSNRNYTDTDGIYSADPRLVENAQVISHATHEEIREKMHGITGRNGVIHGSAIAYAARLGVQVCVLNTFNPATAGTHIGQRSESSLERPVIGVSGRNKITAIDVFDMGMADAVNYTAPILAKVGEEGLSISNYPTGEDRLKLVINSDVSDQKLRAICDFIGGRAISGKKADIEILKNDGAVYLVGQELTKPEVYTRILCRVATIMDGAGLAIRSIVSHEKSPSLMLTVAGEEVEDIVKLLHKELVEAPQAD